MLAALLPLFFVACGPEKETDTPPADTADTGQVGDTADTGGPGSELVALLTATEGCVDIVLAAHNAEDTLALFFRVDDLAEAAHTAGDTQVHEWTLPATGVTLELQAGEHLTHMTCNDAIEFEIVVDTTWTATAGSATLTVTPNGEPTAWGEFPAHATLVLEGVVLEATTGQAAWELPYFTIEENVGWMPG